MKAKLRSLPAAVTGQSQGLQSGEVFLEPPKASFRFIIVLSIVRICGIRVFIQVLTAGLTLLFTPTHISILTSFLAQI